MPGSVTSQRGRAGSGSSLRLNWAMYSRRLPTASAEPGPDLVEQMPAAQPLARVAEHHFEKMPFGGCQPDAGTVRDYPLGRDIEVAVRHALFMRHPDGGGLTAEEGACIWVLAWRSLPVPVSSAFPSRWPRNP